jgi:hypothetical protein
MVSIARQFSVGLIAFNEIAKCRYLGLRAKTIWYSLSAGDMRTSAYVEVGCSREVYGRALYSLSHNNHETR